DPCWRPPRHTRRRASVDALRPAAGARRGPHRARRAGRIRSVRRASSRHRHAGGGPLESGALPPAPLPPGPPSEGGVPVLPRWRRRGIATALFAHRLAYARERGFRVVRFSTGSDNTPIHRAGRRFGFRRIAALRRYEAMALKEGPPSRARSADAPAVRRAVGSLIQFHPGWEWRTLTMSDVRLAI